ncbi:hypothetical protein [Microbacterium gilvum]|uniref:Adhesin domain-containing protein n=1 Tax=Microbacterium gilvum TaxID=1336204 RepID=A0ABP9A4H0_9MICO
MSTPTPQNIPPRLPAPEQPAPQQSAPQAASSAPKAVAIVTAVVGGLALLGTAAGIGVSAIVGGSASDDVQTADVSGVTALEIDSTASSFSIVYGDVDDAVLEVADSQGGWRLARDEDELRVERRDFGGWWLGGDWFDGDVFESDETVVLTLPERLRDAGLDADLRLSSGSLSADGVFGEVDVEVAAGFLSLQGAARAVDVDLSAGRAEVALADVREADLRVAAGRLDAELTGEAPSEVSVEVSAGHLDLVLPAASYAVESEVTAGTFDNGLEESSSSPREVSVAVTAGEARLRSE